MKLHSYSQYLGIRFCTIFHFCRLKNVEIHQGYGLTESTVGIIVTVPGQQRVGSIGKCLPYMSIKIRDVDTGKSLGPDQLGEICVKGPMVMKGYYKNEEATKNSFDRNGWLLTGDLGCYDKDEHFYIVERLKELIKYKGFQVNSYKKTVKYSSNSRFYILGSTS